LPAFGIRHISGVAQAIKRLNMVVDDDKKLSKAKNRIKGSKIY